MKNAITKQDISLVGEYLEKFELKENSFYVLKEGSELLCIQFTIGGYSGYSEIIRYKGGSILDFTKRAILYVLAFYRHRGEGFVTGIHFIVQ